MIIKNTVLLPLFLLSIPSGKANSSVKKTEAFSLSHADLSRNIKHKQLAESAGSSPFQTHLLHNRHILEKQSTTATTSTSTVLNAARGGSASSPSFSQKLLAEAIGTFLIVHLGCGTVCSAIYKSAQQGLWQIAAVWSLAVTLAIYTTAGISGAHLNPAISVAMKVCRPKDHADFGWDKVAGYCVSQVLGAVAGAAVNLGLFWESIQTFEAQNSIVRGAAGSVASAAAFGEYWSVSSWKQAFFAEAAGTCILSFLIFSLTNKRNEAVPKPAVPALIGATVGCLISVIAPLTQAGFNPARDFGPRLVSWFAGWGKSIAMQGWWVYVFGPVVGALVGGALAEKLLWKED